MKFRKLDAAWLVLVVALIAGWFWLWAEFRRVLHSTVREINGEYLKERAEREYLEKELQQANAENERLKSHVNTSSSPDALLPPTR